MKNTHCHECGNPVSTVGLHLCAKCYYHSCRKCEKQCEDCQKIFTAPKTTKSRKCPTCREKEKLERRCKQCQKQEVYSLDLCLPCYNQKTLNCLACNTTFTGTSKTKIILCATCKQLRKILIAFYKLCNEIHTQLDKIQTCIKCNEPFVLVSRPEGTTLCLRCSLTDRSLRWFKNNPTKAKEQAKEGRQRQKAKNPNIEVERYRARLGRMSPEEREAHYEGRREYRRKNQPIRNATEARRRATKLQQTPKWSEEQEIKEFYKNCPDGYHVDHIIPLRHTRVAGLHVLNNLQYLPDKLNIKKHNKLLKVYQENTFPFCVLNLEEYL